MPVEVSLPEIECPDCGSTFAPKLPEKPELPGDVTEGFQSEGFERGTPLFAQITLIQGLLASQRDSFRRKFGFNTELDIDRANLTWTLRVAVPRNDMPADDAVIDAEIVDDEPDVVHVDQQGQIVRTDPRSAE